MPLFHNRPRPDWPAHFRERRDEFALRIDDHRTTIAARLDERRAELTARWEEVKPPPLRLAREVTPGLYQVRTRGSRSYLIVEDSITVIDCGAPGSGTRILEAVRELGRSADDIADILITHTHIDHVGGLPELQAHVPACTAVHVTEAPLLTRDDPLPNPFTHPTLARVFEGLLLKGDPGTVHVDRLLHDGDLLPMLGGLRVVHSPGHTPGSISFYLPARGVLIVGDAMQYRFGRMMLPNRLFSDDLDQAADSIRSLATLDFETLCFSHYRPILRGADIDLRAFAATLELEHTTAAG